VLESLPGHGLSTRRAGKRVAYLFSCTALSGSFGGLLAYALLQMDGVDGKAGWRSAPQTIFVGVTDLNRLVYIVEECLNLLIAVIVFFGLPNDPTNA